MKYNWNEVQSYYNQHKSWKKVIAHFGMSPTTLNNARKKGLFESNQSNDRYDWDAIRHYYNDGNSLRDVMDEFGVRLQSLMSAKKSGKIKTRNLSDAGKLRSKKKPRSHTGTTKQVLSKIMKDRHAAGKAHTLGHNRSKGEPSYPEKWWLKVIKNELLNQEFTQEYPLGRYSIDFAWPSLKIALEIDGEQHQRFVYQIESDKRKDEFLSSIGWTIIRIQWKECFKNPQWHIDLVKSKIDGGCSSIS